MQVERSPKALMASVGRSQGAFNSPAPELQPPFLPSLMFQGEAAPSCRGMQLADVYTALGRSYLTRFAG